MARPFFCPATNLYWVLKGRADQGIPAEPRVGQVFVLEKQAVFSYPVGQVLLVCDDGFEAIAYAKVLGLEHHEALTRVRGEVVKVLEPDEKTSLTTYLQTTQRLMTERA